MLILNAAYSGLEGAAETVEAPGDKAKLGRLKKVRSTTRKNRCAFFERFTLKRPVMLIVRPGDAKRSVGPAQRFDTD